MVSIIILSAIIIVILVSIIALKKKDSTDTACIDQSKSVSSSLPITNTKLASTTVSNMKTVVEVSSEDITNDIKPNNDDLSLKHIYSIGNNYPNGSDKPIGVVYQVSDDGQSGKVVSFDMGTRKAWEAYRVLSDCSRTKANSHNDGLKNMVSVKAIDSDFSSFPAFKWVHKKNTDASIDTKNYASGTKGVWYLPAKEEAVLLVRLMIENLDVAQKLTNNPNPKSGSCFFGSSTENNYTTASAYYAWSAYYNGTIFGVEEMTNKCNPQYITRAIMVF